MDESRTQAKAHRRFLCSYEGCDLSFARQSKLNVHLRSCHTGELPFLCTIGDCDKSFASKAYLEKHQRRPHGPTPPKSPRKLYKCPHCSKECDRKYNLKTHIASHTGEKPFACEHCDQRFLTRSHLKRHTKIHEHYKCDQCPFEAEKWTLLRKHVQLAHVTKRPCPVCRKQFKDELKFDAHLRQHQDQASSLKCQQCENSYSTKWNLQVHIRTEHEQKAFECTYADCDKRFLHNKSLQRHLRHHSEPRVSKNKPIHIRRKKVYAKLLSGYDKADEHETRAILDEDREFRIAHGSLLSQLG